MRKRRCLEYVEGVETIIQGPMKQTKYYKHNISSHNLTEGELPKVTQNFFLNTKVYPKFNQMQK